MGDSPASSATSGPHPRTLKSRPRQRGFSVSTDVTSLDATEVVIPRNEWMPRLMRQHPDVLGLREQLGQVLGVPSFSTMGSDASSRTEIPDTIDPDFVVCLVDQFLREFGFHKASETLRQESGAFSGASPAVFAEDIRVGDLQNLVRLGITPTLFSHSSATTDDPDPELEAVIEGASTLADQDVNIWSEPSTIVTSSSMAQANYLNVNATTGAPKNLIFETLHHHHHHHHSTTSEDGGDTEISAQTHTVKAATFNQLVLWLLSTESDSHFRHAFFATLHSFTTPQQFIAKIEQRYTTPPGLPKIDQLELFSIANTMTHWISTYGHEFSHRIYSLLSKFVENTFIRDGHHHIAESLQNVIAKAFLGRQSRRAPPSIRAQEMLNRADSVTALGNASGSNSTLNNSAPTLPTATSPISSVLSTPDTTSPPPGASSVGDFRKPLQGFPEPKIPKTIFELSLTLDEVDEEEIARQFTCLDSETFHRMKTPELIKNAWLKNRGRKAKRVVLLLNAANALSKWVVDSIANATGTSSNYVTSPIFGGMGMPSQSTPNMTGTPSSTTPAASSGSTMSTASSGTGMGGSAPTSGAGGSSGSVAAGGAAASAAASLGTDGSSSAAVGTGAASDLNSPASGDGDTDGDSTTSHLEKTSFIASVLTQRSNPQLQHHTISTHVTHENAKRIARTITKWIKIAEHLRNLNNFHSLLAIWVALRSRYVNSAFTSLKKEFQKSTLDTLHTLDALFHPEESYSNYRGAVADVVNQPAIPALAIHLRDLALVEEVHSDFVRSAGKAVINFRKRRLLYIALRDILRHQLNKHNLLQVYQVSDRIQTSLIVCFEALQADKPGGHYDYASW